jgi:hypothetical protein
MIPHDKNRKKQQSSDARNLHILLAGFLLLFSTGCSFTRERSFHYSIFPRGDGAYLLEVEFPLRSEEVDNPGKAEQVENKTIAAVRFALEKNGITCNRLFIGESIMLMYDGIYTAVYAGNWGSGDLDYYRIIREMSAIIPRNSIAHGWESFSRIQIGTGPVESVAEKPINKISTQKEWMQKGVTFMDLKTMFPDLKVRQLAKAAGKGNIKKINQLVLEGIDVNARGSLGATPLYWAMRNYEGFKRLLELGADPNIIYNDGDSVIREASFSSLIDDRVLRAALEHGGNPNLGSANASPRSVPIHAALRWNHTKVDILLDHGADINSRDRLGRTPVLIAAMRADFKMVHHLLERGADYSLKDSEGRDLITEMTTFIRWAEPYVAVEEWQKVIDWLQARGVKITAPQE